MMSTQEKIQLWLYHETIQGRLSDFEELSEMEANMLVQRFATDVNHIAVPDSDQLLIKFSELFETRIYKLIVKTPEGVSISFRKRS